ncbi:MAG: NUDIX domain-containing protein [Acidimicrobiia bacterium]|nr:NUDIX domain-containing protein [Acidimicrobiia bacterium]
MTVPGRIRVSAYAVVLHEQSVLMSRVAPGNLGAGTWTLPGGGLAFGEHPDDALLRELYEETGLRGKIVEPIGVDSRHVPAGRRAGVEATHWIRIYYRVSALGEPRAIEVGGSADLAAWHPLDHLPEVSELAVGALARVGT